MKRETTGSVTYHDDGTATIVVADTFFVRVTPEQAREWSSIFAGIAETAEALALARQQRLDSARAQGDTWRGLKPRPIGWMRRRA